jgi:hypothetical protein
MVQPDSQDGSRNCAIPAKWEEHVSNDSKQQSSQSLPASTGVMVGTQIHINTDQHGDQPKIQVRLG